MRYNSIKAQAYSIRLGRNYQSILLERCSLRYRFLALVRRRTPPMSGILD